MQLLWLLFVGTGVVAVVVFDAAVGKLVVVMATADGIGVGVAVVSTADVVAVVALGVAASAVEL